MAQRRGLLIILSSPSGAGKSTLARRLREWDREIRFSVSVTTRAPREGEVDGREYHFIDKQTFERQVQDGALLEHAEVFGNHYGSPKAPVMEALEAGADVIFDIDWQGGQQIKDSVRKEDVVSIFVLPPSIAELERRLQTRAQDSAETIAHRMTRSRDEISHWREYDYVLINSELDETEEKLRAIVTAERLRRTRQVGLSDRVSALNIEFESFGETA